MWVIDQKRDRMFYSKGFRILGREIVGLEAGKYISLGSFSTPERAQEVLFEIKDRLEDGMKLHEESNDQLFTRYIVFEIPVK